MVGEIVIGCEGTCIKKFFIWNELGCTCGDSLSSNHRAVGMDFPNLPCEARFEEVFHSAAPMDTLPMPPLRYSAYRKWHERSLRNPEEFWKSQAESLIVWEKLFSTVLRG